MPYEGFIVHHSRCPSINGKGFDFWVGTTGLVYAAPLLTDAQRIHICLEGDFDSRGETSVQSSSEEQLFAAGKLILELAERYQIAPLNIESHNNYCPGAFFPWNELVVYPSDGYH
ncbi:peptidoglycan recognition protein family protein [Paenibacillus donghaensis]|uniref:N-acetylmuramoyl-L-alanine amidase n=1 Tax=Paenibacillus donghaensis TaxID=414771 RepID=A0A2Z2KRC8_9BACL|nr:N-acetylmuramoyl-L-alanine amidase [Paenibacillus donghaensis]ASA22961.1 N-acetylmuramoyl-L-alanine amidase [Paenibacillus donghaensis]